MNSQEKSLISETGNEGLKKIPPQNVKKRKIKDILGEGIAYLFSSFGIIALICIVFYIFSEGGSVLSWQFISSNYNKSSITCSYSQTRDSSIVYKDPGISNVYFSSEWGIGLEDSTDSQKKAIVAINYIDNLSPFKNMTNSGTESYYSVPLSSSLDSGLLYDKEGNTILALAKNGAKAMAEKFDEGTSIVTLTVSTPGGGIKGSLITTFYMIILTLAVALPIGTGGAIYLTQYAKQNRLNRIIKSLINITAGIPTIIFGLVGAIIFIPFINAVSGSSGGSILSGALTLSVMLLPIIIATTEEAIKTIPSAYSSASLALGASQTQTTFRIILPNALPGIMTAVLLSIGRIIGESAALIYAVGTSIKDQVILNSSSTTLAVHIWSLMAGENPNFKSACAISIIIIVIDLVLNILVKIFGYRLKLKFQGGKK
jgi:phosphate transport system permease protein